jgi:tRNA(Ile2)-agmatinylcytidine synthase
MMRNCFFCSLIRVSVTIIGIDDTDSREKGMCTTYAATRIAERILDSGFLVDRRLLIRLNPAVKRKTRGNAALAIHTDMTTQKSFQLTTDVISELTVVDERTSPGIVVADCQPKEVPERVVEFSRGALREIHELSDAIELADEFEWLHTAVQPDGETSHDGHGRIGALAAIGAYKALDEWTYEHLAYREFDRCGTEREVNEDSVFAAAESGYPVAWDTVDREENKAVCVPNAPGPILYGIRGDDPSTCREVAEKIESEPVEYESTFQTNQGTDVHIADGEIGSLRDDAGYAVEGIVVREPETRRGGHTFFELIHPNDFTDKKDVSGTRTVSCVAFEPTKRFRGHVRNLRVGDRLKVLGEHENGTIKLEKFAVLDLVRTEQVTPTCPECESKMESSGHNQGYRCRRCQTSKPGKEERVVSRELREGWYEVPPCARRHIAKPLIRGGFEEPTHPER